MVWTWVGRCDGMKVKHSENGWEASWKLLCNIDIEEFETRYPEWIDNAPRSLWLLTENLCDNIFLWLVGQGGTRYYPPKHRLLLMHFLPNRTKSLEFLLLKTRCTFAENQRGLKLELSQNLLSWVYFVMLRGSIGRPLEKKGNQPYLAVNPVC